MDGPAIRWAGPSDHDALGMVMFDAVHTDDSLYTAAQRAAWMPTPRAGPDWSARLGAQRVVLAEDGAGRALGFMGLEPPDHLDFAYIRPEARGRGLFRRLFAMIEAEARALGACELRTEASLLARGPMETVGFVVQREETVSMGAERLRRFVMRKPLSLHAAPPSR